MDSPYITDKDKNSENRNIPDGVKIIAILNYIGFGLLTIIGLILLVLGVVLILKSGLSIIEDVAEAGYDILFIMGGFTFLIIYLLFISFAVLLFFIGRGLWKLKNWARIACIVLGCLGMIVGVKNFIEGLIASVDSIIVLALLLISFNALIAGYLMFNKKVKQAFTEKL